MKGFDHLVLAAIALLLLGIGWRVIWIWKQDWSGILGVMAPLDWALAGLGVLGFLFLRKRLG